MEVAMSCQLTSTCFVSRAGQAERSAAREAIFIRGARLCLWTAHPDPAQRHRAHASGTRRSAWHWALEHERTQNNDKKVKWLVEPIGIPALHDVLPEEEREACRMCFRSIRL